MIKIKILILSIFCLGCATHLYALTLDELKIISRDGTFLGSLNQNEYDPDSVYNQYGKGNPFDFQSIMNEYCDYGSDYSDYSPFNLYANNAPGLYDNLGNFYGILSINRYAANVTDLTYRLALRLKAYRDSL